MLLFEVRNVGYNLFWQGDNGYTIKGMFSFDETQINPGSIVTKNTPGFNLDFSIFNPNSDLLATYISNQNTYSALNFNFDTSTKKVLQSGGFDAPDGFDLGIFPAPVENTDFSFYTSLADGLNSLVPTGTIRLCSGSSECDISNPVGQGGILDEGGVLIATSKSVPEPGSISGLLALGAFSAGSILKNRLKRMA